MPVLDRSVMLLLVFFLVVFHFLCLGSVVGVLRAWVTESKVRFVQQGRRFLFLRVCRVCGVFRLVAVLCCVVCGFVFILCVVSAFALFICKRFCLPWTLLGMI